MLDLNPVQHLGLVWQCVNRSRYKFEWEDPDDLFQEGCIGLLKACNRHDGRPGFSGFALKYIQGAILHYIRRTLGRLERGNPPKLHHNTVHLDALPDNFVVDWASVIWQESREDWEFLYSVWQLQWERNDLERSVLQLRFFEDLSRKQIAEELGLTLGQVDHYTKYGLTHLRWAYLFAMGDQFNA